MAKPSITTRAAKGSALTWTEGDTNLTNLRDATVTIKAGTAGTDVVSDLNGTVTLVAGTNVTLSGDNTAKTVTINASGGSGITDVVQDTTPQLGGDLDVNAKKITATAANDVTLEVTGSGGHINLRHGDPSSATAAVVIGNGTNSGFIHSNGATTLALGADIANGGGATNIELNADGNIYVNPRTGGKVFFGPAGTNTTITTNSTTDLVLNTNNGTNSGSITIADGANQNITIAANGTGVTVVNGAFLGAQTSSANLTSPILGRNIVTVSDSKLRPSLIAQKARSDILLAAMTNEPSVIAFSVRDSAAVNRAFATMRATYQGTGTNPTFSLDVSTDSYTTTVPVATVSNTTTTFGSTNANYTLTTNGTGNLTLSTNSGTNSGTISIANGVNGNITIAPNGTGDVYIDADTLRVGDTNATASIISNGDAGLVLTGSSTGGEAATISLNPNSGGAGGWVNIGAELRTFNTYVSAQTTTGLKLAGYVDTSTSVVAGGVILVPGTANSNISITPDGTGDVQLNADTVRVGDSNAAVTITTNGTGNLTLNTNAGTNSGSIVINQGANANIELAPNGTGDVYLTADTVRVGDSNADATITTNGTGDLILNTNSGTSSGNITINDGGGGYINITPEGTGRTVIKNLNYYENVYAYGNSGLLTWAPDVASTTASNIVTMTLTGNLTFNGFTNPISGQTLTVVLTQDGTGGKTLTSTMKFAGGSKTLSTAANAIDILTVSYIGTTYYATLSKGYA